MPLVLHPATPADLSRIVAIEIASFAPSPLTPLLNPNGHTPASTAAYISQLAAEWASNSATRVVKVVDTERGEGDGEIVAFARWYVYVGGDVRFVKTVRGEGARQMVGEGEGGAAEEFFGGLLRIRTGLMGREEHCCESCLLVSRVGEGMGIELPCCLPCLSLALVLLTLLLSSFVWDGFLTLSCSSQHHVHRSRTPTTWGGHDAHKLGP